MNDMQHDFIRDLAEGQRGEDLLIEFLTTLDMTLVRRPPGYHPEFDFEMRFPDGTTATFEVKWDEWCARSGNVALETKKCSGGANVLQDSRPSGIAASKACVIAYLVDVGDGQHAVHLASPAELMVLVRLGEVAWAELGWSSRPMWRGQDNNAFIALVDYQHFKHCFPALGTINIAATVEPTV